MITEDYVSFETAKLLKERGFDADCSCYYFSSDGDEAQFEESLTHWNWNNGYTFRYSAPTLQMAMKWLRKNHNFYVTSVPNGIGEYIFYPHVYKNFEWGWTVLDSSLNGFQDTEFSSPEEACEAAIKYCLENLI